MKPFSYSHLKCTWDSICYFYPGDNTYCALSPFRFKMSVAEAINSARKIELWKVCQNIFHPRVGIQKVPWESTAKAVGITFRSRAMSIWEVYYQRKSWRKKRISSTLSSPLGQISAPLNECSSYPATILLKPLTLSSRKLMLPEWIQIQTRRNWAVKLENKHCYSLSRQRHIPAGRQAFSPHLKCLEGITPPGKHSFSATRGFIWLGTWQFAV